MARSQTFRGMSLEMFSPLTPFQRLSALQPFHPAQDQGAALTVRAPHEMTVSRGPPSPHSLAYAPSQ